jgi:hypothetical protein
MSSEIVDSDMTSWPSGGELFIKKKKKIFFLYYDRLTFGLNIL